MIVATYGAISRMFDGIGTLTVDSTEASSVVKPNSSAAARAPNGVHRPKISAASAM
jgi:hypothetical protein